MNADFTSWTYLFVSAALLGIAFSLYLLFGRGPNRVGDRLLGLFLLLFSLTLGERAGCWTGYLTCYPHLYAVTSPVYFALGPVLFLYVTSILKPAHLYRVRNLIHFLPFMVFLGFMLPSYLQPDAARPEVLAGVRDSSSVSLRSAGISAAQTLHLFGYSLVILFFTSFRVFRSKVRANDFSTLKGRWIKVIGYNFLGYTLCFTLYHLLAPPSPPGIGGFGYVLTGGMAACVLSIVYLGNANRGYADSLLRNTNHGDKLEKTDIKDSEAMHYTDQLLTYMDLEKPHKDGELKLDDLARELSIPAVYLLKVMNERLGKGYSEFINDYRVRDAKKILSDPEKRDYRMLRVAFESGFSSRSAFRKAFKRITGMTPSKYRSQELNRR